MRRVALRGIRAHLVRFLLSVLAVTLGVAFVAGTFSLRTMMSTTFDGIVSSSMDADVYVRGNTSAAAISETGTSVSGDSRNTIPLTLATAITGVDGVVRAVPGVSGSIVVVGADGTAVTASQAPSYGIGYYPDDPTTPIVAGRAPTAQGEIALESATLATSGLVVGDRTRIVLAGAVVPVTVVGEVSMGAPMAGATMAFLDLGTATTAYAPAGLVPTISVYAAPGISEQQLVARLAPVLAASATTGATTASATTAATGSEAVTGDSMRDETRSSIEKTLGFVETFMLVFAGISLFVGAFIISNTFAMSVQQRMREFALLRAIGASPAQVFSSIVVQAAVIGLAGSALGIAGGLGLVSLLRTVFAGMGMNLSGSIPLEPSTVLLSLALGTLVSVVAAAVPARRAALTAPVEAMRGDTVTEDKSLRTRSVVGAGFTVVGAAGLLSAWLTPDNNGGLALGIGGTGLVLGMVALAPVIARSTLGPLAAVFVATVKPLGRLAKGNVMRNPRRTANTAGALMIGMALVGGASVLAATATASTQAIVDGGWKADYSIQSVSGAVPAGAVADIRALDAVQTADMLRFGPARIVGTPGESAELAAADSMFVVGLPAAVFGHTLDLNVSAGSLDTLAHGDIAVRKAPAKSRGWTVGDTVTFTTATGPLTASIGAIVDSSVIGSPIILPDALFDRVVPAEQTVIDSVLVTGAPGASADAVRAELVGAAAPYVVLSVLNKAEFADSLAEQVNQILVILYALLGLSIVIAVLGIVNTLALSVIERTREIGLMRAIGLGRLQLAGIVTIESVLTALFGTIIGVLVGVTVASVMPSVFADVGLGSLAIPWAELGGMLVLAAVVGVLAALWPAVHAARLPVLEAVSSD